MGKSVKTALLIFAILLLSVLAFVLCRDYVDISSRGFIYTIDYEIKTCTITDIGTCSDSNIIIPKAIKGYKVTAIGDGAFSECENIKSVKFSNNLIAVGYEAFSGCSNLTSVKFSNSVTTIESKAFYECKALTSVTLGKGLLSIGVSAFQNCSALTDIKMPSVATISSSAFENCTALKNITLPDNIKTIGSSAFEGCTALKEITIPNRVTSIGSNAFTNCKALTNAHFENTSGWEISQYGIGAGSQVATSELKNATTAAKALTSKYHNFSWKRSSETVN